MTGTPPRRGWVARRLQNTGVCRLPPRGRNLAADPRWAVHLESGDDVVVVEGRPEVAQAPWLPSSRSRWVFRDGEPVPAHPAG